ncbi:putative transcription factor C2H2 family [Helianthus annuus]|nr:putative transcription factor C2H2 family [Helianthus annuus]
MDMDFMDIDQIEEVPDTPERFITTYDKSNTDGNNSGNHSNGSSSCRVIDRDHFNQKLRNEPREKGKSVAFNGSRRLFVRADNFNSSPGTSFGKSPSSKNVVPTVEHPHHDKGKTSSNSSSFVDLTEQNGRNHVYGLNNAIKLGPKSDNGKRVAFGAQQKAENGSSSSVITPSRVNRHIRFVKNGCISPLNIAKTKPVAEKDDISTGAHTVSDGPSSKVDIKDIISEAKDAHRLKGKGVSHHPISLENSDPRNTHLSQRRPVVLKEATNANKDSKGWITTHGNTRKVDPTSVNSDQNIARGKSASSSVNGQLKNGKVHADLRNGSTSSSFNNHFDDLERAQFTKRQKEGVGSSNIREEDAVYVNNADVASSSLNAGPSSSRSIRNKNRRGAGSSDQAIVIEELSHEGRNKGSSSNEDSTVRALQLEADERLARELQEQLYNESPAGFGVDEMDSHHALAMAMQQERSLHARGRGRGRGRGRSTSHARSSSSRSVLSNRTQTSSSTILARMRGRFPGRPRTISTRSSIFPSNMDVDMRMHILEALEAFNDMELPNNLFNDMEFPNNLFQVGREFNENDYEMLLALDDNNHQHGGATNAQINNLPQSTVQAENLQECAICLEAPNVGETIRHLPCLHKFHKDCIDEWLRRKTSCPPIERQTTGRHLPPPSFLPP